MRLSVDSLPANTLPTVLACETLADGVRLQLRLDPDLPWFAGHFPGAPLLPGVTQIHWVMHYAASLLCWRSRFTGWISSSSSAPAPRGRVQLAPAVAGGQGPASLSLSARR